MLKGKIILSSVQDKMSFGAKKCNEFDNFIGEQSGLRHFFEKSKWLQWEPVTILTRERVGGAVITYSPGS